jgi:hypothetical protein
MIGRFCFVLAVASDGGDNDFRARNIRNSISLTISRSRRMILLVELNGEKSPRDRRTTDLKHPNFFQPVPVVNSIVLAVDRESRHAGTRCWICVD